MYSQSVCVYFISIEKKLLQKNVQSHIVEKSICENRLEQSASIGC